MKKAIMFLLVSIMLAVSGGLSFGGGRAVDGKIEGLIREHVFRESPKLNPQTRLLIDEFDVSGLEETLGIRLFLVGLATDGGERFDEKLLLVNGNLIRQFGATFGGSGLMSAVVSGKSLYYSYSFGSGVHRSHVGRMTVKDGDVVLVETDSHPDDLFVRVENGRIRLETGSFERFNSWKAGKPFGRLEEGGSALRISASAESPRSGRPELGEAGKWEDDAGNWYRMFQEEKPSDVEIIHSLYWRSDHFTDEFMFFAEVKASAGWRSGYFKKYKLEPVHPAKARSFRTDTSCSLTPGWFVPGPIGDYDVWDVPGRFGSVWIDRKNGHMHFFRMRL